MSLVLGIGVIPVAIPQNNTIVGQTLGIKEAQAKVRVKGYYRKNGTYVQPHYRTSPNRSKADNWSSKGNVNPYTGKRVIRIGKIKQYSFYN